MQDQHIDSSDSPSQPFLDALRSLAVSAWTIQRKARQLPSSTEADFFAAEADALFDALRRAEVEVEDYSKQPYRPGMNVEILVFQPSPTVEQDTITTTVRPAVFFRGRIVQRGQVVVSTPEKEETS